MASDSEASCVSDPNFAVICSFLEKFGASCGITSPDFLELQEMLENTQELSQELIDIHIKLLRKVRRSVSADRWERVLIKLCHTYCSQDAWELERFGYKKARLTSKLRILKKLLEMQFDLNQKFKAEVNRLSASELRTEPIGRDKHGHSYWYQIDEHCQLRVYREDPDEETWVLVANNREGLMRLISQLASDDPNLADIVLNEDSNSLEIEKPILDTGQTSSSTSNCEAEVDESSAGNEDSKDISSEPQTETSPSEMSATEASTVENAKPVVEKHIVEEKPAENNLKIKISSGSIIPHKPKDQPENLVTVDVKKEKEIKTEEKIEKPVGIDLSIPQTSKQPPTKGVDLTNKRKKSINDLAANLRMKTHDMLYKNPVQEQEMDLSVKKPRMDPKQFSSLSVPPFEPISIESALRMSSEFPESDEEIEDEEDEFDDEDEIDLPSHMKQPRLSRPTLLGNTKKKSYSDEEEEYGEEIEEPVMLIRGEGSGKDCNNENIHVNKSEDYSEAVEESVMFFYGEGSGHDCDTGNTGKKEESTNSDKNSNDLKDSTSSEVMKSKTLESVYTKEQISELKTIKDTESASNSSSEVLEATDKQVTEQCLEKTVVDSKDIKSELVVNESKNSSSQENELSPKCHKVGTIVIDVKSGDRGQTSDAVGLKRSSRWDIGKPVKNDNDSTRKNLCDDSTNSSIIIIENSDVKLLNVSKDETNNTNSDINLTDVKTAVNKTSELQKLDESKQDSDKKETYLEKSDNLSVVSPSDTHEALIDQKTYEFRKSETGKTDEVGKQPKFFFGPGCFKFKTPMAPYSPDVKGLNTKDSDSVLKPDDLLQNRDQENEACTEKISSISESVPTCINKADILIDNKKSTTSLQTTNLSTEIKSINVSKLNENVDLNIENVTEKDSLDKTVKSSISENVEQTKIKEKICILEAEVKSTSIDNEMLPTENKEINFEEVRKSDNNSFVVEAKKQEDINIPVEDTTKVEPPENLPSETSIGEENEIPEEDLCTKVLESENLSSDLIETNLESVTSKQDEIKSNVNEEKDVLENIEESKINIDEMTAENKQEENKIENNNTSEIESETCNDDSNKSVEKLEIELDESKNISLNKPMEDIKTDSFSSDELESKEEKIDSYEQNIVNNSDLERDNDIVTKAKEEEKLETESDTIEVTTASEVNPSSPKKSEDLSDETHKTECETNVDNKINLKSNIAQDELSSSNIVTKVESCSTNLEKTSVVTSETTKSNIETEINNSCDTEKGSELSRSPKVIDEITDDKSETLSETLESLSTLIESKSDESDDQLKKSENDDESSSNENLHIVETSSNSIDDKSSESDTKSSEENIAVISQEHTSVISEEKISEYIDNTVTLVDEESKTKSSENTVTVTSQHVLVTSEEKVSESVEKQISVSTENSSVTSEKNTEDTLQDDFATNKETNSSTVDENNSVIVEEENSHISAEKVNLQMDTQVINEESKKMVDQEVVSSAIPFAENISTTLPETMKENVEQSSLSDDTKLNTDIADLSVSNIQIENDLVAQEDTNKLTETSIDSQSSLCATEEVKLDSPRPIDKTFKNDASIPEESKQELKADEVSIICERNSVIETEFKASETDTIDDSAIKTNKETEFVDVVADKNSESSNSVVESISNVQNDEIKSETVLLTTTTKEDINMESVNPVIESVSEDQSDEAKSETIVDKLTVTAKKDIITESVNPVVSQDQRIETKSETEIDEPPTSVDKNEESRNLMVESVTQDPSDETKFKTIVELPTTEDKNIESLNPVVKSVSSAQSFETVVDEQTKNDDTNIESVNLVVKTVSKVQNDEAKFESIVDKSTTITREEENVTVVADTDFKSDLQTPTITDKTKNVETEMKSSVSTVETISKTNDSILEQVVNEPIAKVNKEEKSTNEINLVENIDDKSVTQNQIGECKPEIFDESTDKVNDTNSKTVNSVPQAQINEPSSDKNEENIFQVEKDSSENMSDESKILITKSNQSEPEVVEDNPVESSLKDEKDISIENETTTTNESRKHEKGQEIERAIHNLTSNKEENKETGVSKNDIDVGSKYIEPDKTVKDITEQKEIKIENMLCKDEIGVVSDIKPDIRTENIKQNCHIINKPMSNKTVDLVHNLEKDKKETEENRKAFENDKHPIEVNHVAVENDIKIKNADQKLEKSILENPKHNENKQDEKQAMEISNKVKEYFSEQITDSILKLPVTVDNISKNNECKKVKSVDIFTLEQVSKEKFDDKKIDDVKFISKAEKQEKSVTECKAIKTTLEPQVVRKKANIKKIDEITLEETKKIQKSVKQINVNSHEKEVKDIKESDPKENLKSDSVFDQIKETKASTIVRESTQKDSGNTQKIKVTVDLTHSGQNEEVSSDDDMMDSCTFEQGNEYNDDSDGEEKSTFDKKDNISEKIKEKKVNHTDIKVKGSGSKIILKNINDLIDNKNKLLDDKSEVIVNKFEKATNVSLKDTLDNVKNIDVKPNKLDKFDAVDVVKIKSKDKKTTAITSKNKSKTKTADSELVVNKPPKLICVDITKLQEKSPLKPENKTIVELKQQSEISSPRSLESVGIDNEESSDVIDVPETDPLACSEEEIIISKKIEEETSKSKPKGLSLATFKLDDTEEKDTTALIPEPIARALRNRKVSIEAANASIRKRSSDVAVEGSGGKKRRGRGRRPTNIGNRPEVVNKDASSSDEENNDSPPEVKVTTPQRGTGKARRGRGRGRGRGAAALVERIANDSPALSSDPQSETSRTEITSSPVEQKTPTTRKKRRVLGLDIDPAAIIQNKTESDEHTTRSSVRQSRRIAQIKIKEEAERRKIEELTLIPDHKEHKKKKKKKDDDKDFKVDKKNKKYREISEDEDSEEEITEISSKGKHKKKRKHQDVKKLFNISNPWQSSSESSTSNEEEEEEVEEEPTDEEVPVVKSDHEFSPESDLESTVEIQPLRRARTVKKESDTEEPTDEHACQKCGKADHPEWILLCDKCDCGWHCSCLRPALLVIPEGDWFCPPCQHLALIEALKTQLVEYDKKMNRREMEVRRKERLAYVGISLDNVLPAKESEAAKDDNDIDRGQEMGSGDDSSESGSDSESGSSSGDESEPIYQLRERRQAHSYRFNDYDELINSAIQDELEAVKGAGNQGRGKDIATIVNAEKEEAILEQQKLQEPEFERPPPVVPVYEEKPEREPEGSDESSDEGPRVVPKHSGRKKHRKLNSLDISSEDDPDDDEDFKGTSASEEEDFEDLGSDDSELDGRRGRGRSGPTRRSTRARTTRYDREFINDDSEDDTPRRKKPKSIWDESESEESDKSWGKRKKSVKKQRHSYSLTPRTSKKSRKKKRRNDDSDPEVKNRPKKPKIKYGGLNDSDDEELLTRRTRGKKINYIDALGSDTDEDKKKSKPLESEDEYMANEDDEDAEEALNPIEDEEKDTDSDSPENTLPMQRKIIKIIAPSKVAKGRGKAGIPRPLHLKPVTPPPPPPLVPEPEPMEETPEDVEDEEEESEPPVPVDIPVIAANPDDLNEEEVGTMMMENEEYAKKQLELMAIQLAKDKKKKEKEAKKLAEKKEIAVPLPPVVAVPLPPAVVVPAQPKKRGRKKKSEIEAQLAAAAAAAAAAAVQESRTVPPITINTTLVQSPIQNPVMSPNQPETEKLTPPRPNINIPHCEIPSTVPTVVSDLSNSPPKRRGRGKGKKTLAAEAAAAGDPPSVSTSQSSPESITAPTIVPPLPTPVLTSTASSSPSLNTMPNVNIPTSAQTDPQNLSPNPTMHGGKLGIATPPQPFSQNQPTPSVITRMLQSQPISAQTFTTSANAMNQKYFPPGMPPEQQPPRGSPSGQFSPIAGRGRVPSPYRQSPPAMGMYPGVRPMAPNSPHRLRSPGPPNMQMFHSTHHSMDPSPSGGGPINIAPHNRDRNSPGNVGSPMTSKEGPTPPPPPYSRALTVTRFSPSENSPGPSLPPPIRHHMFPQAAAHLQQPSPPPRPPPPGNFSPYHPPPPPNYHYGAYPPAPSLAAADDALPPTDYQGSPYPEHYNTAEGTIHSSEGSNSKPFDEEGSGEFGGLVSYFSSQREDDLDT